MSFRVHCPYCSARVFPPFWGEFGAAFCNPEHAKLWKEQAPRPKETESKEVEHINKTNDSLIRQIEALKKREELLVNALKFYATNTQDQMTEVSIRIGVAPYDGWRVDDNGMKARQALKELGVEV